MSAAIYVCELHCYACACHLHLSILICFPKSESCILMVTAHLSPHLNFYSFLPSLSPVHLPLKIWQLPWGKGERKFPVLSPSSLPSWVGLSIPLLYLSRPVFHTEMYFLSASLPFLTSCTERYIERAIEKRDVTPNKSGEKKTKKNKWSNLVITIAVPL